MVKKWSEVKRGDVINDLVSDDILVVDYTVSPRATSTRIEVWFTDGSCFKVKASEEVNFAEV